MSVKITTCDNCQSKDFTDINPEVRNEQQILVTVKAKCNDCGHEFEYSTFSHLGRRKRASGYIW